MADQTKKQQKIADQTKKQQSNQFQIPKEWQIGLGVVVPTAIVLIGWFVYRKLQSKYFYDTEVMADISISNYYDFTKPTKIIGVRWTYNNIPHSQTIYSSLGTALSGQGPNFTKTIYIDKENPGHFSWEKSTGDRTK